MSGNVNVGFIDGRVHNRVLKPPGGGYSEIFFTSDEEESPKKAPPARSESLIESILRTEEVSPVKSNKDEEKVLEAKLEQIKIIEEPEKPKEETQVEVKEKEDEEIEKDEVKEVEEVKEVKTPEPAKTPESEKVRKGRVPPGGYSSGLW